MDINKIMSKYTCKSLENSYSGHGWQGVNYARREYKAIASELRKAFKRELPGFKFSVTTRSYSSIIVKMLSGNIPQFLDGSQTTLNPDFVEVKKAAKAIINSYNYSDCDSMSDYFDVGFYDTFTTSYYEYIPTAEPKTTTAPTASEVENLDGVTYTAEEDADTRTGEPITVVKLAERVDRSEYQRIAEVMKGYGGYYSRFKGGFIFKTRPAFLDAEPVTADNTPGGESEELATVETVAEVLSVEEVEELDEAEDLDTSEEQPQTSGEIIRRGRNIYHSGANAAKVVEDFGQVEIGKKYTLIKFDEWGGNVEITYLTALGVNVRKYAQYETAVEITYKAPRKRHTDKKIMHEEQSYILYDGFVSAIPDSVLFNIEERPDVTTKMSKYSCCDIRNLIDIKKYYAAVGVLPLADTLPELDDPQPPTDPTPSEPEELPTLSPTLSEPENTAEAENLDPIKGEGGGSQKSEHEKFIERLQKTKPTKSETIKEAAEYYKKALEESGIETWAVIVTANKYSDILTSAEILEAIENTDEDTEPPTDPQPTKPTEDSEPTEESPTEAPGEDMPSPSPTSSEENSTAPTSDPEPIGAGELPETEPETVSAVIAHELPKNLIEQANNNSQFNRGDSSARSYAAYCEAVQSWDISDNKKQKILDKVYKKYLPILQNQAAWVPWTVAGPARYNAKKLDKGDRVMQLSAEFSDWFNGIKNGIQSKDSTGHDEKTERVIKNIGDCIANKDSEKIRLDWGGLCRKYLEELATLSQSEFVKWFEESNKAFKFRKSTTIYKLYVKASAGEQITAEKKELFSDENLTAYSDGGRVYIRFFSKPAQQLKFALKKRGYWWNSYRSEWSTYESRYNAEWVQGISTQYEKHI